jgi:RNA polymerase sigma-70 factor, ECF subfamily
LGAPSICFGIKQTSVRVPPLKTTREYYGMTQSGLTLKDNTLVELALAGQTECFSVLMNRHAAAVRKHLSRLVRDRWDLDDVVQDTFTKAWTRLSTFRFEASFRTWLISVALNEALILYRRRKHRLSWPVIVNLEALPSKWESPYQTFSRIEARLLVRTAVQKLPRKYSDVLVLCDLEELTVRETAKRMNASIPLVKTRLFRARRMLAVALNEQAWLNAGA